MALIALSCSLLARAQVGAHQLDEYRRTQWGSDQGLSAGRIQALAQTPDGYLWVGAANGLFRFDGFRFVPILTEQKQPLRQILGLTVDKQGILWVRTADTRLRRVERDSVDAPAVFEKKALGVLSMSAAQTRGIYATDVHKSIVRLTGDHVEALPIHSKALLIAVSEATDGRLWIGTDRGLLTWTADAPKAATGLGADQVINCLLASENGHVWVGTDKGLAYWDGRQLVRLPFSNPDMQHLHVLALTEDRDKSLWLGTSKGLARYTQSGVEWVSSEDSSAPTSVTALTQDRQGDVWYGVGSKLERLESTAIVPVKLRDPTSGNRFGPLYVDHEGRVWSADLQKGLSWMQDGSAHTVLNDGLPTDEVYSIDGLGDNIWVGRRGRGLTRLRVVNGALESKTWDKRNGLAQSSVYVVRAAPDGTVWAGTLTAGLDRFQNGKFTHFDEREGLPSNAITAIEIGTQGQVWIGTPAGVCSIEGHRCSPLSPSEQNSGQDVLALLNDPSNGLWIGTAKGLFLHTERGFHAVPIRSGSQPMILGLGADRAGRLWIVSDHSVMSAIPKQLLNAKDPSIRNYGIEDGLESIAGVRRSRSVVTDTQGQVWMTTAFQVARVGSSPEDMLAAIPQVEEVTADGALLGGKSPKVPAGAKRLTFAFTGLDLHAPSRVRFRYRLDNFDKSWSAVVSDRQATYTNLPPGEYTFRLIASNESDSWSSSESTIRVKVEPLIWQRWSVRSFVALVIALLAMLAYQTRTRKLLAHANILADERLRERTRIARDVHDTLLQGFISSLMHLHVAQKQIPSDSPFKDRFTSVLEGMERVIEEARLTVVGLRTPESGHECLEGSLRDFFLEIGDLGNAESTLRSSGTPRRLKPKAYEDISSIAREAILNAVRHANARTVRVTIDWGWRRLRLQVSDDGSGIDPDTLQHGRAQHWGLASMRERAEQLKAHLSIESDSSSGTQITLSVPSSVAYIALNKPRKATPADAE